MAGRIALAAIAVLGATLCSATAFARSREDYRALELFADVFARIERECPLARERAMAGVVESVSATLERARRPPFVLPNAHPTPYEFLDALADVADQYGRDGVPIVMRAAVDGALRGVSPRSFYAEDQAQLELGEPGVRLRRNDPHPLIHEIAVGGSAERAGLRAGDALVVVDGQPTSAVALDEVYALLRGPPGSSVVLSIARPGVAEAFAVELVRESAASWPVSRNVWRAHGKVGVITLQAMNPKEARDGIRALVREIDAPIGFVLDLRGNVGGRLDDVIEIADMFLDSAPVGSASGHPQCGDRDAQTYRARRGDLLDGAPLAVLVGPETTAGAEWLASALIDNGRARAVGQRTLGWGDVETVIPLTGGRDGWLRITTAVLTSPSGKSFDGVGLEPEIAVPESDETHDYALDRALEMLRQARDDEGGREPHR